MKTRPPKSANNSGGYVLVGIAVGAAVMSAVLVLVLHCGW